MRYVIGAIFFSFLVWAMPDGAFAQSACVKCQQAVQAKVAACSRHLPRAVTPKNAKKPTRRERKAMKARADAYSACVKAATDGMAACRTGVCKR
jgi:hypothetical protein